jgi:hypothetical protein
MTSLSLSGLRTRFEGWLFNKKPYDVVGDAGQSHWCPIAMYFYECGYVYAQVMGASIIAATENEVFTYLPINEGLYEFIVELDRKYKKQRVTAAQVLEVLRGVSNATL